jgi:large subunit ribosomal protein L18
MRPEKKARLQQLRRWRIRKKVAGTPERPRMSVCFTNQNIYVQFVDDSKGVTIASASTRASKKPSKANVSTAKELGAVAAQDAQGKGISQVVFDRSGAKYHGKVKALADAAREAGLKF